MHSRPGKSAEDIKTGNFLFIAIYVFSKEALAHRVEQTIAVSISWYVE